MTEWHYMVGGKPVGPITADDIERKFREGVVQRDTLVWTEGMPEWRPMHEVDAFSSVTRKSSPPPIPGSPPVAPSVEPNPTSDSEIAESSVKDREQIKLSNLRTSEPRIPWSRYFARMLDVSVLCSLILILSIVVSPYISPSLYLALYTSDERALVLVALPFVMVVNAIIITIFGNSLGKKIFGIHAVNVQADRPFTFMENIARELRVWARGLALGIPIVNFFTMIPA